MLIALFTDFGTAGPYLGQMRTVLARESPGATVIDLMNDAPAFDPRASAYLLASLLDELPGDTVVLGVVDPGVGSAARVPVVAEIAGRRLVGPGNGLFSVAASRAGGARWWRIDWRPARLAPTFHGRDLFAPVAAAIARGEAVPGSVLDESPGPGDWPGDLAEIVYLDGYGNAWTGLRASTLPAGTVLEVAGRALGRATTFSDVPQGQAFWYENSNGLAEIAVNGGSARALLGLEVAAPIVTRSP